MYVKILSKNLEKGIGIVSFSLYNKKFYENLISKVFFIKYLLIYVINENFMCLMNRFGLLYFI